MTLFFGFESRIFFIGSTLARFRTSQGQIGMIRAATETGGGLIKNNFDTISDSDEEEDFTYEEITELLILVAKKRARKARRQQSAAQLRKSLFPHVEPYVDFQSHNGKRRSFPKEISERLTWELGTSTPWIVKKTIENSGYRSVVSGREDWWGTWSESRYAVCYNILKSHQKMNHFPGTYEIGHKDRLWKNIKRLMEIFGRKQFSFVPRTFILPEELSQLREAWEPNEKRRKKWILKPPASSRGRGVSVVSRWSQIPRKRSVRTLVQRYVSKPKLINDSKFDLRVYAVVTDFNPLKIFLYSEGLARFACGRYDSAETSLNNRFVHLTNYSVNKSCAGYESNDTIDECKGHKWSLKCLWRYLGEKEGVDVEELRFKIRDIIVKAFISAESSVACFSRVHLAACKHNCYELFGFDILIDEKLKPWLLEVNISPSLHAPSPLDLAVKGQLIKDVLNLAGYRISPGQSSPRGLNAREKRKQTKFMYKNIHSEEDSILEDLTPDDVRILTTYEDELAKLGGFERIFPTSKTRKYLRYFETPRYYNLLLNAWEIAHSQDRQKGVSRLRDLCKKKHHLR